MRLAALALAASSTACLGPQVPDQQAPSGDIVPAGTTVPSIDEEADDAAAIAAHDGVDGIVPRLSAFAAGAPTHVWDFGPAPMFAAPIYIVMRKTAGGGLERVDHPAIVGVIPGDAGYSPYWSVFALVTTDAYAGEQITSSTAVEEAVRTGLVETPAPQGVGLHCPIIASDVRLDVGTAAPLAPAPNVYYEHHLLTCVDFGTMALIRQTTVPVAQHLVLRRPGEEPLSEPVRHVDIDGDGDTLDSNDIFERAADDPLRTPLCRRVDVVVVATATSIDTSHDEASAQLEAATQLFAPGPVTGTVVAYQISDELRDCPAQRTAGGL